MFMLEVVNTNRKCGDTDIYKALEVSRGLSQPSSTAHEGFRYAQGLDSDEPLPGPSETRSAAPPPPPEALPRRMSSEAVGGRIACGGRIADPFRGAQLVLHPEGGRLDDLLKPQYFENVVASPRAASVSAQVRALLCAWQRPDAPLAEVPAAGGRAHARRARGGGSSGVCDACCVCRGC
jgi:hypothetical protein